MKVIFTITAFIFTCYMANAQQALIKFDEGSTQDVYITDIDSLYITTSVGRFSLTDLKEVTFPNRRGRDVHLYYELGNAGVVVSFNKMLDLTATPPPPGSAGESELDQFKRSLKEYQKNHQIATGLQLTGVMLGVIGMIIEENGLKYAGLASAGAGLILELSSANKLKLE